jgi:glycosyltransferase involved in cell wall biosynthesis
MTTVSIALATYNGSRYIDEQLGSLARQRRLPDELVATDDGSSDDTVARLEAFAATAPFPVRVHRNDQRLGYRANFLRAAGLCRSELIAFSDQDDVWEEGKLLTCLAPFSDRDVLLVYHDALATTADGYPIARLQQLPAPSTLGYLASQPMNYPLGFTQVFRRSLLDFSALWHLSLDHKETQRDERMAHDQWVFFLAAVFGSITRLDEVLVRYRQHETNSYGWTARSRFAALRERLWPSLRGRAAEYAALERAAGRRGAILDELANTLDGTWQTRAAQGAGMYRRLEALYQGRRRLYGSTELPQRAGAFWRILTSRGYRPKQDWGLGSKALVTDLVLGVPAGYRFSAAKRSG